MALLSTEEKRLLVKLGFAACQKGKVKHARDLFEKLLEAEPDAVGAKVGLAFSHIVVNDFAKGDELLNEVMVKHPDDMEAAALRVLSFALQKKENEAREAAAKIPEKEGSAYSLAQGALALL